MKSIRNISPLFLLLILLFVNGCDESLLKDDNTGTIVVNITDGPFNIENIESAVVTITRIEIRKTGATDTVPFIKLFEGSKPFDLINLRNGLKEQLITLDIPVGNYDLIRLYTGDSRLKVKNGGTFDVKIPGGEQTGIKCFITPDIKVEGGLSAEILIDFDLSRSFILKGNPNKPDGINGFNFKPVVRVVNNSMAGIIEGTVTDIQLNKIINASVWVQKDTLIARAFSDNSGKYSLPGIPEGIYRVGAAKEGYDSLVFAGVRVVAANVTTRNFALKSK